MRPQEFEPTARRGGDGIRVGRLAGIGSLIVGDGKTGLPGNMFVPIDHLRPVMGIFERSARPSNPPRPWLGVNLQELLDPLPMIFYRCWQGLNSGRMDDLLTARV
jgi:hypothetical protein